MAATEDGRTPPKRILSTNPIGTEGIMENIIVGIIALLLFGYLFVAMIKPEKF